MDHHCQFVLLGVFHVVQNGRVIDRFQTRHAALLLAHLAYYGDRTHLREKLADMLWPDDPPEVNRHKLREALSSLRRLIEPQGVPPGTLLVTSPRHVRLNLDLCTTDVAELRAAREAARTEPDPRRRIEALARAVQGDWGELLPGFSHHWVLQERGALAEQYWDAVHELVTLLETEGEIHRALGYLRHAVQTDPLREESQVLLMRLLAASGRPDGALRQYRTFQKLLDEELGQAPSPALRALAEEIARRSREAPLPVAKTPLGPASPAAEPPLTGYVPLPLSAFFGRGAEMAELQRLLSQRSTRLVTLTGPGGCGKTRLAQELAYRLWESFQGAVWFAPLVDLVDGERIAERIAATLGRPRSHELSALEQIFDALSGARVLLLLDNLEHLVDAVAPVVRALLERLPGLVCLATSRRPLLLPGEHEFHLTPLPVPEPTADGDPATTSVTGGVSGGPWSVVADYPSVQLFVDRARHVKSDFQITASNAAAVAKLCSRLEGLPLAIELAAGWARDLSPAKMLERTEQRLGFLISRQRTVEARHRTLRAALEWSFELLPPELRQLFPRLSVFRGVWDLAAVEALCREQELDIPGSAMERVAALREHSLVIAEEQGEETRYRMLESVREYACEHLQSRGEEAAIRGWHARYFLGLAEETARQPKDTPLDAAWHHRLEQERSNLGAALAWTKQAQPEAFLRLCLALRRFWNVRGHWSEAREWLEAAITFEVAPPELHWNAVKAASDFAVLQTDFARAWALREAYLAWRMSLGDRLRIAHALHALGSLAMKADELARARALFKESLAECLAIDDHNTAAGNYLTLGAVATRAGDLPTARDCYEEALSLYRRCKKPHNVAKALCHLGRVVLRMGELERAYACFEESADLYRTDYDDAGVASVLLNTGHAARQEGDTARALACYGESVALWRDRGDQWRLAGALGYLGDASLDQEDRQQARRCYAEALTIFRRLGSRGDMGDCLERLAHLAGAEGQIERAAWLHGAAAALHAATPGRAAIIDGSRGRAASLTAIRQALGETAFAAARQRGRQTPIEQILRRVREEIIP